MIMILDVRDRSLAGHELIRRVRRSHQLRINCSCRREGRHIPMKPIVPACRGAYLVGVIYRHVPVVGHILKNEGYPGTVLSGEMSLQVLDKFRDAMRHVSRIEYALHIVEADSI